MPPNKWPLLTIGCVVVAAILVGAGAGRLRAVRADLAGLIQQRERLEQDIKSYHEYESRSADTLFQAQPKADFEQRVRQAVQDSGINPAPRYTVSVQPDQEHRDRQGRATGLRTQRASLQISGITPEQIGVILSQWRQRQEIWAPVSIGLMHDARTDQNRYTLRMDCLAKFHEQGSPS